MASHKANSFSLVDLKNKNLKSRCGQVWFFLETLGEELLLASSLCAMTFLGSLAIIHLSFCLHNTLFLTDSPDPTPIIQDHYGIIKILNLITSTMTSLPYKVTFHRFLEFRMRTYLGGHYSVDQIGHSWISYPEAEGPFSSWVRKWALSKYG